MATSPVTIDPNDVQMHVDPSDVQPEGSAPQAAPPQSGFVNPLAQAGADLLTGAGKGVLQTVHGTGELIRKGMNLVHSGAGDAAIPPSGQQGLDQMSTPTNTAQKVGVGAESIAEMALGDEALKGLSIGDKLLKVSKLADTYEKATPFVRAAIEHGLRAGATTGAETAAKTGDLGTAAKAGAGAAAAGAAGSVAMSGLGAGLKYLQAAKTFQELPAALDKGLSETVSQKAVTDGLKATQGATASEHLADSALQYQQRAKQGYQVVDNAVNGELQPIQDKLDQVKKAIKIQSNLDPDKADALKTTKTQLEKALSDTIAKAKANGVPDAEQIIQKADGDYTKFRAQSDLSTRLQKAATAGGPASPASLHVFSKQVGTPKVVGKVSRLEQALGKDGAEAVQKLASEGRSRAEELARQAEVGNAIKKTAITGAVGAAGAGAVGYPLYRILGH